MNADKLTISQLMAVAPAGADRDVFEEIQRRRDRWAELCAESVLSRSPAAWEDAQRYEMCRDWLASYLSFRAAPSREAVPA